MKKMSAVIFVVVLIGLVFVVYRSRSDQAKNDQAKSVTGPMSTDTGTGNIRNTQQENRKDNEIVAQNLNIPWNMVFLPDGGILVTERAGTIRKIGNSGFEIKVDGVEHRGEGGLLGMALHPEYAKNNWLYLYHTTKDGGRTRNMVVRYVLENNQLTQRTIIIDNIPASANHNGGRIAFGPDGLLYITAGDSETSSTAQDKNSLAGKILRVKDDGSVPQDNPFGNAVWAYGLRNPQGLAWDDEGRLWATDHGRSGALSGYDELNQIKKGANYGWPTIQGDESREGMERPVVHSGPDATWAPSGATFGDGSILFAGLRGEAVYEYKISEKRLVEHFKKEFGRLRAVSSGGDGSYYILTNNTDGRGNPKQGDDKIIKIPRSRF